MRERKTLHAENINDLLKKICPGAIDEIGRNLTREKQGILMQMVTCQAKLLKGKRSYCNWHQPYFR